MINIVNNFKYVTQNKLNNHKTKHQHCRYHHLGHPPTIKYKYILVFLHLIHCFVLFFYFCISKMCVCVTILKYKNKIKQLKSKLYHKGPKPERSTRIITST